MVSVPNVKTAFDAKAQIQLEGIHKSYLVGDASVVALNGVSLTVQRGEFIALTGASGSGKTTLMSIIGCLDRPEQGDLMIDGIALGYASEERAAVVRNKKIGFIFQSFNLIPRLTVLHNVELPMMYAGISPAQRRQRAMVALQIVGMQDRVTHTPAQLSGGQQQRVAIARALVNNPDILLADEPTGNLDPANVGEVMKMLIQLNRNGKTIILVTHDMQVAQFANRVIFMRDGKIISDIRR